MSRPSRLLLSVAWLLVLAAFAGGVALLWDYLVREHARLTPAQIALLWSSEAVSGFWFLRFGVRHLLFGVPLPAAVGDREFRVVWWSLLAGWLLDVSLSVYKHIEEATALRRSVAVEGRLLAGLYHRPNFELWGEFTDAAGVVRPVSFVADGVHTPQPTQAAAKLGRFPGPLPLRYDPDWPDHTWLEGEGTGSDRVYLLTGIALIAQGVLLERLRAARRSGRSWRTGEAVVEQAGLFAISAVWLLVAGGLRWLPGHPLF